MLIVDMFAGRRVAYADYLGYDEVAHHSGRLLRTSEVRFARLTISSDGWKAPPVSLSFVEVLSGHGQSTGATFKQRYGLTLDQLLHRLIDTDSMNVQLASGGGEAPVRCVH